MSAGTPRTTVRIATELMERVERQLESLRIWSPKGDWSVGEFIRVAIEDKLKKYVRSRRRAPRHPDEGNGFVNENDSGEGFFTVPQETHP